MSCDSQFSVALPHGAWVSLPCVNVVFPDHTHLLFESNKTITKTGIEKARAKKVVLNQTALVFVYIHRLSC